MRFIHNLFFDPAGKPGIFLWGTGTLLNIAQKWTRSDAIFYASMYSLIAGGTYYLLKIIFEIIKNKDK